MKVTDKFFLIAGPCVIESQDLLMKTAEHMKNVTDKLGIEYVFKSSFDKANRSSVKSWRGPGLDEGLKMLEKVKKEFGLRLLTDIHTPQQIAPAAEVIDILQIPAFLARQTDFYIEAGRVKAEINVKKGQFMSPWEMGNAIEKFRESGGEKISITERGTTFGYGNLVVDFRSVDVIKSFGVRYIFDATHSVQLPAARGASSGGERQYIPVLSRAQIAAGADGLFMEVHPQPESAQSDRETQMPLEQVESFLKPLVRLHSWVREQFQIN